MHGSRLDSFKGRDIFSKTVKVPVRKRSIFISNDAGGGGFKINNATKGLHSK